MSDDKTGPTLTDFLLARIAEDEGEANTMLRRYLEGGDVSTRRWRRVLAECDAKRRIVGRETAAYQVREDAPVYEGTLAINGRSDPAWEAYEAYIAEWCNPVTDTPTLRDLAVIYSGHPDYRDEWRP